MRLLGAAVLLGGRDQDQALAREHHHRPDRQRSLVALLVGLVAGRVFEYGRVSLFQGPISRAINGVDFSWLASIVFGGLAYWLPCRSEPHLVTAPSPASGGWRRGRDPKDRSAMNPRFQWPDEGAAHASSRTTLTPSGRSFRSVHPLPAGLSRAIMWHVPASIRVARP